MMIEKWKKLRKQFCISFNGRREKWGVTAVGEDVLPVYFLNGKKKKAILKVKRKT
jgi:hypothetical protein